MTPSTRYGTTLTAETAEWAFHHLEAGKDPKELGWRFGFDYFKQCRLVENYKKTKRLDKTADLASFLALLGLTTGVRSGSLRVLRPEDIRDGYVHVIRGLSGAGQIVDTTKTGDHQRIPVLPNVEQIIREYWGALPAYKQTEGWLFPSESGGIISEPALNAAIKAAGEAVGVRMTTHGLRRTAAHLLRQFAEIGVSKTITGHSGDEMFLYYSVAEEKERREAVEKAFGSLLGSEGTDRPSDG